MMDFILSELTVEEAIYYYYPEGKDNGIRGIVGFNRKTGRWRYIERSQSDTHSIFTGMIATAARKLFAKGEYPHSYMIYCY